jgi:hypothetical protein
MRNLMAYVAALGAAPIVAMAVIQTAAPVLADTPGVSPTCFPQTMNPHPTDPAGTTTNTLFCTPPSPAGSGRTGSGTGAGTTGSGTTSAGTTTGGGQTSAGSGTAGSFPDERSHASGLAGTRSANGTPAASTNTGLFGGLVGFFASAGGLVFLFGLLMLMLIALIALAVIAWIRRGGKNFASRFSRVTYRA